VPTKCLVGDEVKYNSQANALADGRGYDEPLWPVLHPGENPPPAAEHPPLTVLVLTPVSWLLDRPPLTWMINGGERPAAAGPELVPFPGHAREHRYTMVVLGTLLVGLIGLFGRRVGGDAVGLLAAGIAAVSPNIWVNDGLVMSETIVGLTVVGAMWATTNLWDRPTRGRAALLGFLCGLAALARPELLLLVPLLAVVVAGRVPRPWSDRVALGATAVGLSLLTVAPWGPSIWRASKGPRSCLPTTDRPWPARTAIRSTTGAASDCGDSWNASSRCRPVTSPMSRTNIDSAPSTT
jgi:Dolichyl-phosphate-mannose-protein mannosyltransferase